MDPLVTVICTCFNHEKYLKECLDSVFGQTYSAIEVIIVDDASSDGSPAIIEMYSDRKSGTRIIFNATNKGICRSFNSALVLAKGKYVVDLATDDVMLADKIEKQVRFFESLDESYGVVFTNALHIDENSASLGFHFKPGDKVPQGDIYQEVIRRFFLPSASLMVRKKVLDELGGYDESLAYEDFDFWVRSSRNYKYAYLDASLVKHRKFKGSLSTMFLRSGKESMLETTYKVCCKALWLNKNADENHALCQRLYYEMKQTFFMENFALAKKYRQLIKEAGRVSFRSSVISLLSDMKFRTNWLYAFYLRMKGRL